MSMIIVPVSVRFPRVTALGCCQYVQCPGDEDTAGLTSNFAPSFLFLEGLGGEQTRMPVYE